MRCKPAVNGFLLVLVDELVTRVVVDSACDLLAKVASPTSKTSFAAHTFFLL